MSLVLIKDGASDVELHYGRVDLETWVRALEVQSYVVTWSILLYAVGSKRVEDVQVALEYRCGALLSPMHMVLGALESWTNLLGCTDTGKTWIEKKGRW